jgi:hypothetical protein
MSSHNQREEEELFHPVEKGALEHHTELEDTTASKSQINYEDASKLEGATCRRKVNEPGSEDVEDPQTKGETAKPPFWMKSDAIGAKRETVEAHPWMKDNKKSKL